MSILKDRKKSLQIYIYIKTDTTTDHITPCSRMRARGKNTVGLKRSAIPPTHSLMQVCEVQELLPARMMICGVVILVVIGGAVSTGEPLAGPCK